MSCGRAQFRDCLFTVNRCFQDYSLLKTNSPLVLTENKRKHSMISKKSKYTELDEDEDEEDDDDDVHSDIECQYLTCLYIHGRVLENLSKALCCLYF